MSISKGEVELALELAVLKSEIRAALEVASAYGSIDGEWHKQWVIDQMVRALTGAGYEAWVKETKNGEEGPETYEWEEGIPP